MKKSITTLLSIFFCIILVRAQQISFRHLTTANGLSDNKVHCAVTDKNGFLWVGTANGLNRYDGYTVISYFQQKQPQLCNNDIAGIICDSKNRIWVGTYSGVTMIDEERRFHKVIFDKAVGTNYSCAVIIESKSLGIIMYTARGHYRFDEKNNKWEHLEWSTKEAFKIGWKDDVKFDDEQYIHTGFFNIIILDYASQQKSFDFNLPFANTACRISNEEILASVGNSKLIRINISQKKIVKSYPLTTQDGNVHANIHIQKMQQAANGDIIISSASDGLFIFNPVTEKLIQLVHSPFDNGSISEGEKTNISCDKEGNVFICGKNSGLDYFNISNYSPAYIPSFSGSDGETYDGPVNCIMQDKKGRFWLGGKDCLIMYNPLTGKSIIYRYYYPIPNAGDRAMEINCVCIDNRDRIWAGTNHGGLGLLNEVTGKFIRFTADGASRKEPGFPANGIYGITRGNGDSLWIASSEGLFIFNSATYRVDSLVPGISVKEGIDKAVLKVFKDSKGNFWIGTWNNGMYWFNPGTKKLNEVKYAGKEKAMLVNDFAEAMPGKIYAATKDGISFIDANGNETSFTSGSGGEYKYCSSLLTGSDGKLWFSSNNTLSVFDTHTKKFSSFDETIGQRTTGFGSGAIQLPGSLQYWAADNGIISFNPDKLQGASKELKPHVYGFNTADSAYTFAGEARVNLSHKNNSFSFFFSVINLYAKKELLYKYRLSGVDEQWISSSTGREVKYNSLPPGTYKFSVIVSRDGINWSTPSNTITVVIAPALWQTWWFRVLAVLLITGIVYYFLRRRIAVVKEKEKLKSGYEKKIAEVEMSSLRAQMNPHFMFNSLNSINNFILKNDPDNASGYLTKFSRLMRLILDNSRSEWVVLENELKALELYIELEAVRFDNAFAYTIEVAKDINAETATVPPLLIQPYVENAIWHGLMHRKEPGGRIDVRLRKNNGILQIEIEDNGVGRDEAKRLKSKTAIKHKSHGMKITAERMEIVNKVYNVDAGVTITDLTSEKGACGTKVLITLQYKNHDGHNS